MTSVVVDASVAMKWLVSEVDSVIAERLLTSDYRLLAPDFIRLELANALWKRHRQGELDEAAVATVRHLVNTLPLHTETLGALVQPALTLALKHGRTVYDSLYLALAIREECQLVTADARFYNAVVSLLPNTPILLSDFSLGSG
jgi:predicted nucleic acid-binding protein